MKRKTSSLSGAVIAAIAAGSLCLIGPLRAQVDTAVSDNPHLRAKHAPPSPGASVTKLSEKDTQFIQMAATGGAVEVADGKVAEGRGQSGEVKKIGARMVAEHSKANNELVELAKKKGVTIDISKVKPRDWDKANFDRQYLVSIENDHETDIKLFEKEASSGDNADLKAWASKTLPTLRSHLAMVKDAMKKMK